MSVIRGGLRVCIINNADFRQQDLLLRTRRNTRRSNELYGAFGLYGLTVIDLYHSWLKRHYLSGTLMTIVSHRLAISLEVCDSR
jgi:hypothetical protein